MSIPFLLSTMHLKIIRTSCSLVKKDAVIFSQPCSYSLRGGCVCEKEKDGDYTPLGNLGQLATSQ